MNNSTNKILILFGSGRSGTTFITKIMRDTYSLGLSAEPKNVLNKIKQLNKLDLSKDKDFEEGISILYNFKNLQHIRRVKKIKTNINDLKNEVKSRTTEGMILGLFTYVAKLRGSSLPGYQNPLDIRYFKEIKKYLPGAYFIHFIRKGENVAESMLKFNWGPTNSVAGAVFWKKVIAQAIKDKAEVPANDYIEVRIEDFHLDFFGVTKKIDDFISMHISVSNPEGLRNNLRKILKPIKDYEQHGLQKKLVHYLVNDMNNAVGYTGYTQTRKNYYYELMISLYRLIDFPVKLYNSVSRKSKKKFIQKSP